MRMTGLTTLMAAGLLSLSFIAQAQEAQPAEDSDTGKNFSLFYTNAFSSNAPSYNVGMFVTPDIMPYVGLQVVRQESTSIGINVGSRFYVLPLGSGFAANIC
jgi:hypothetical protein